jgi:hypothetical protein
VELFVQDYLYIAVYTETTCRIALHVQFKIGKHENTSIIIESQNPFETGMKANKGGSGLQALSQPKRRDALPGGLTPRTMEKIL